MAVAIALAIMLLSSVESSPNPRGYTSDDTIAAIEAAAADTGASYTTLYRIVRCETGGTFNPYAEGDRDRRGRPHSHGAAQLNDYGNALPKFYAVGYDDPYNPDQAVHFMAESLVGQHPPLGRWTWSC